MTTRRLMILVVVASLLSGAVVWVAKMRARSTDSRHRAEVYAEKEVEWMRVIAEQSNWVLDNANSARANLARGQIYRAEQARDYYGSLREKWERHAARPWSPVEPDPVDPWSDEDEGQP